MSGHQHALRQAEALAAERDWGAAAVHYAQGAVQAQKAGAVEAAREAWEAAGECWRRDDRPKSAVQAFEQALELAQGAPGAALIRARLAGALGDLGDLQAALSLSEQVVREADSPQLRAMGLDGVLDGLVATGRKDDARPRLNELRRLGGQGLQVAVWFREGQLLKLDGALHEASVRLGMVIGALESEPQAIAGAAAALAELGELAMLRGEAREALEFLEDALERFERAGRRSPAWRALGARVRAATAAGLQPLLTGLHEAIDEAMGRAMPLLEADLRMARGEALLATGELGQAREDLERAVALSAAAGAVLRAGRARLLWARLPGERADRLQALDAAVQELEAAAPWAARARLAQAALVAEEEPARARPLVIRALARLEAMDMGPEAEQARRLLIDLG